MHLKLPLQISVEANAEARPIISEAEARAIAAREAHNAILPRNLVPPSPEYTERAELMRDYNYSRTAGGVSGGIGSTDIERRESLATTASGGSVSAESGNGSGSWGGTGSGSPPEYSALGEGPGVNPRFSFGSERPPYGSGVGRMGYGASPRA